MSKQWTHTIEGGSRPGLRSPRQGRWQLAIVALVGMLASAQSAWAAEIVEVRVGRHPAFTRVVFELDRPAGYRIERSDPASDVSELVVSLEAESIPRSLRSARTLIEKVDVEPQGRRSVARVRLAERGLRLKEMILANPPRIVLDVLSDAPTTPVAKTKPAPSRPKPSREPEVAPAREPAQEEVIAAAPPAPAEPEPVAPEASPEPEPVVAETAPEPESIDPADDDFFGSDPQEEAPSELAANAPTDASMDGSPAEANDDVAAIDEPIPGGAIEAQANAEAGNAPTDDSASALAQALAASPSGTRPSGTRPSGQAPSDASPGSEGSSAKDSAARPRPMVAKTEPVADESGGWMTYAAAGVGAIVLLLGGFLFVKSRSGSNASEFDDSDEFGDEASETGSNEEGDASNPFSQLEGSGDAPAFGTDEDEATMPVPMHEGMGEGDDTIVSLPDEEEKESETVAFGGSQENDMDDMEVISREQVNESLGGSMPPVAGNVPEDFQQMVMEMSRRMEALEGRVDELVDARDRLERQVAAQTEELRVQRAAIARTQRAVRNLGRPEESAEEQEATEPALRDPNQ